MHRRGISCIIEAAGRRLPSRYLHTISEPSGSASLQHPSSAKDVPNTVRRARPLKPTKNAERSEEPPQKHPLASQIPSSGARSSSEGDITSEELTRAIFTASKEKAGKRGWTQMNARKVVEDSLRKKVQVQVPTQDKVQFCSRDVDAGPEEDNYLSRRNVRPGAFVELRRNLATIHGVVLSLGVVGGRPVVFTMASTGEVFNHGVHDVVFSFPSFVSQVQVQRCGDHGMSSDQETLERSLTENEVAARVFVLKRMRDLLKHVEECYLSVSVRTARALRKLRPSDPTEWSQTTTPRIARTVFGHKIVPLEKLLAVHTYLMSDPVRFVAHAANFLATQAFWVRPSKQVKDIEFVVPLITANDPRVDTFIEKAKKLIAIRVRAQGREGSDEKPHSTPIPDHYFTEDEQSILRFLIAFVNRRRSTQRDPFLVSVASLARRIGVYPRKEVNTSFVHQMLIEMGVLPPWDDPLFRSRQLLSLTAAVHAPESGMHATRLLEGPMSAATVKPTEFYPSDPLADKRHDFEDLPVYVVDSETAEERDDGVAIERDPVVPGQCWVHIHIADPTSILHPNHVASQQARKRMVTGYFLQQSIPMLSLDMLYDSISLGSAKGRKQNSLAFSFKVNPSGEIIDYAVRPALISNVKVISYAQANVILGVPPNKAHGYTDPFSPPGSPPAPLPDISHLDDQRTIADIKDLQDVATRMFKHIATAQTIIVSAETLEISGNIPTTEPIDLSRPHIYSGFPDIRYTVLPARLLPAQQMISELMKSAGRVASMFFRDKGIPAVRRASMPMYSENAEDFAQLLAQRDDRCNVHISATWQYNVALPLAENTVEVRGHPQMGVPESEGYVRVSSPLRRFGDLLHHWQIKHALSGGQKPFFDRHWLTAFGSEMGLKEAEADKLMKQQQQFWAATYIDRYRKGLIHHPGAPADWNALDMLEVTLMQHASKDLWGRIRAKVHIPSLGSTAIIVGIPRDTPMGTMMKARVKEVNLGTEPLVYLSPV